MNEKTERTESKYQDIELTCIDCELSFIFTAGEQRFYSSKGLSMPKRCQPCRKARKDSIAREERW